MKALKIAFWSFLLIVNSIIVLFGTWDDLSWINLAGIFGCIYMIGEVHVGKYA